MAGAVKRIVIVGGGTAGWISASVLAAEHFSRHEPGCEIVLVESPDIPTIGVGEGTWPSMRLTLQRIGLPEHELIRACDASFKQGTRFDGWAGLPERDRYYHPFTLPAEYSNLNLAPYWLAEGRGMSFAGFVTPQAKVADAGLAPKQASTPPYAFAVNYGYHFDAGKFAVLLREHAVAQLGVRHVLGNVERVEADPDGYLTGVVLDTGEQLTGDLFVDCTGQRALLIGRHFGVDLVSVKDVLFNDAAVAVQVPYADPDEPIRSVTCSTAMDAGWIWDIGLQSRRGVGYVFSRAHTDDATATARLESYIRKVSPASDVDELPFRVIPFEPGYRDRFWVKNCVAVGLSGGFIEPLEASALALIEQAASLISEQLPADRQLMPIVAKRFNAKMHYHWTRIIEFLKLHYAVSQRCDSDYWMDCRSDSSWPEELKDKLLLWQQQPPWHGDAPLVDELFPSASYQYVLYGMGFRPRFPVGRGNSYLRSKARADGVLHGVQENGKRMLTALPTNRELINELLRQPQSAGPTAERAEIRRA